MRLFPLVMRALVGLIGTVLLILGITFWTGHGLSLVRVHMTLGGIFVLCLWLLAGYALLRRVQSGFAILVLCWGLVVLLLGVYQMNLLPGRWHWVVQALHLVVGGLAIGLGQRLAQRLRAADAPGRDAGASA